MMKKDKILLMINDLNSINDFQKLEISNFLFPLENFSIGYNTFSLSQIEKSNVTAYLLVNRLLTDDDIDEFLQLKLPSNIKGILIEDVGLYYALRNSKLELFNFQNHLNNSLETVNFWLDYYDSLVTSTDITYEEIKSIIEGAKKPLIINTFGFPMIMYSRRHLLSNFYKHIEEDTQKELDVTIPDQVNFRLNENDYGTAIFDNHLLDIREEIQTLDESKIKFYLFNTIFLDFNTIKKAIKGEKIENITKGFLNTKTIYRIGDIK